MNGSGEGGKGERGEEKGRKGTVRKEKLLFIWPTNEQWAGKLLLKLSFNTKS